MSETNTILLILGAAVLVGLVIYVLTPPPATTSSQDLSWGQLGQAIVLIASA
jgi:hypothetical protein